LISESTFWLLEIDGLEDFTWLLGILTLITWKIRIIGIEEDASELWVFPAMKGASALFFGFQIG